MPIISRLSARTKALCGLVFILLAPHSAFAQSSPCRSVDLTSGGAAQIQWAGFIDSPEIHCFDVFPTGFNQRLRDFATAGLNTSDAMTWASTQAQLLTGLANVPQSVPFPGITFGENASGYAPVSTSGPSGRSDFVERLRTCQGEVWTNSCSWYSRIRGECAACKRVRASTTRACGRLCGDEACKRT